MTQVTRFAWPVPLLNDELGYATDDLPPSASSNTDFAYGSNFAAVQIAVQTLTTAPASDLNIAATVTNAANNTQTFTNVANVHDGDGATSAKTPSVVVGAGTQSRGFDSDLGSAALVSAMVVQWVRGGLAMNPSTVESSDDGVVYTNEPGVWTGSATRTFTLNTPASHRYWRIRAIEVFGGLTFMSYINAIRWSITGSATVLSDKVWEPAPAVNDRDNDTYNDTGSTDEILRVALDTTQNIGTAFLRFSSASNGSPTYSIAGTDDPSFASTTPLASVGVTEIGAFTPQTTSLDWTPVRPYQYYEISVNTTQVRRFYSLEMYEPGVIASIASNALALGGVIAQNSAASNYHFVAVSSNTGYWLPHTEPDPDDIGDATVEVVAASGSTETIDYDTARFWDITLTDDCTFTITNPPADQTWGELTIILRQGASPPHTVTWPASVQWADTDGTPGGAAPTLFTTEDAIDVVTLVTVDGGVTWGGSHGAGGAAIDYAEAADIANVGTTASAGVSTEIPRADHVHDLAASTLTTMGARGELLIKDGSSTPPVFDDILVNDDLTDFLYADLVDP